MSGAPRRSYDFFRVRTGSNYCTQLGCRKSIRNPCTLFPGQAKMYSTVLPTAQNVWPSLLKMDKHYKLLLDPTQVDVLAQRAAQLLEPALVAQPTETPSFVPDTVCGFPFSSLGFKTKASLLSCPEFYSNYVYGPPSEAIWKVSPKEELKLDSEIASDKIRTFIVPPLHLLFWQKYFFAAQDELLKGSQLGGIAYGACFAYGGFDAMFRAHGDPSKRVWFGSDVSGWDRMLLHLRKVYDLRCKPYRDKKFSHLFDRLKWVVNNTVNSNLLLPNGDVVNKCWGNNSGSGTTTCDNCIAHVMIMLYLRDLLVETYHISPEDFLWWVYGDDSLCSLPSGTYPGLEKLMERVYQDFGLVVKPGSFFQTDGPVGAKFLGATCVLVGDMYAPSYDEDRISDSLVLDSHPHMSPDDCLSKAYSLLHLSWNSVDLFYEIRSKIVELFPKLDNSPMAGFLTRHGVPTRAQVINQFWLGCEECDRSPWRLEAFKNVSFLKDGDSECTFKAGFSA